MLMARRVKSELVVGARARVVTPRFFVRCGYPMTVNGEAQRIMADHADDLRAFARSFGLSFGYDGMPKGLREIARGLAYELCHQKNFGGRQRSIYTREVAAAAGVECEVIGVRFVKTGEYEPSRGHSYDWTGSDDYEPPHLSDEKTHRLLRTPLHASMYGIHDWDNRDGGFELEIEVANVELVAAATPQRQDEIERLATFNNRRTV